MRRDQWGIFVSIDGRSIGPPKDSWDVLTGGEADSDELKYRPGGMKPELSLGGSLTIGACVVSRIYLRERDHANVHWLIGRVGKGKVVVKKQPLDIDGNSYGNPIVTSGILKRVTTPEVDSNSTEAALLEIEVAPQVSIT